MKECFVIGAEPDDGMTITVKKNRVRMTMIMTDQIFHRHSVINIQTLITEANNTSHSRNTCNNRKCSHSRKCSNSMNASKSINAINSME